MLVTRGRPCPVIFVGEPVGVRELCPVLTILFPGVAASVSDWLLRCFLIDEGSDSLSARVLGWNEGAWLGY